MNTKMLIEFQKIKDFDDIFLKLEGHACAEINNDYHTFEVDICGKTITIKNKLSGSYQVVNANKIQYYSVTK